MGIHSITLIWISPLNPVLCALNVDILCVGLFVDDVCKEALSMQPNSLYGLLCCHK